MITAANLVKYADLTGPNALMQAETALETAQAIVGAYCRGRERHTLQGEYKPGVEAVILTVASRIASNPSLIVQREQVGPYSFYRDAGFQGFTLTEQAVLDRYRKRAI